MSHIDAGFRMAVVVQILLCLLAIPVPGLRRDLCCCCFVGGFWWFGFFSSFLISTMASAIATLSVSTADSLCGNVLVSSKPSGKILWDTV